eukprot:m.41241 g.41241  ORF g.41241 m.41241 type:complete len:411 (-) comp10464_c0_seq3:23-1255(-)
MAGRMPDSAPPPPPPPRRKESANALAELDELEKQLGNLGQFGGGLGGGGSGVGGGQYDSFMSHSNTLASHHHYEEASNPTYAQPTLIQKDEPFYDQAGPSVEGQRSQENAYAEPLDSLRTSARSMGPPLAGEGDYTEPLRRADGGNYEYESAPTYGRPTSTVLLPAPPAPSPPKAAAICVTCDEPITTQIVTFAGKTYHYEHFVCTACECALGTASVYVHEGGVYCEKDYTERICPKCFTCGKPIVEAATVAMGKNFHREHFVCKKCGKLLDNFMEHDGHPYCREDYAALFATPCKRCQRPIVGDTVTALSTVWHPACFTCADCGCAFPDGQFYNIGDVPLCAQHHATRSGNVCVSCNGPIQGKFVSFKKSKYHPQHFCCTFCKKALPVDSFMEKSDKPYCQPCYVKNFG